MDFEKISIFRLKEAEIMAERYYNSVPLILYSGGKDSDVILDLAKKSKIKFEVQHSHTTADAPETVYHIRRRFYDLECDGIKANINYPTYKGQPTSMWKLIPTKKLPPTRLMRYCCSILKETSGHNRVCVSGVRRAESQARKSRGVIETITPNIKDKSIIKTDLSSYGEKIFLNNDNAECRKIVEHCQIKAKTMCNIIADWGNYEVLDYIKTEKIKINPLYEYGFGRVGCIGCPMAGTNGRQFEFQRYPKYKEMYIRSFNKMLEIRKAENKGVKDWQTGVDVFHWWMQDGVLAGQMSIDGEVW